MIGGRPVFVGKPRWFMRNRVYYTDEERPFVWHPWLAWYPVATDEGTHWLTWVERRLAATWGGNLYGSDVYWSYREPAA